MSPTLVIIILITYFLLLIGISSITTKNITNTSFFTGNKKSPWYLVAFGMTGATLSGVTFISIPGETGNTASTYLIFVLGNAVGYIIISRMLLPLYYKLKVISIYSYLHKRFGITTYKTGASFFILSQTIGASFRLFLVGCVLQIAFFDSLNIPFSITILITILLIWIYTFKGGIRTIVYTDALQTLFILAALISTIVIISKSLDLDIIELCNTIKSHQNSKIIDSNWQSGQFWLKQFFAGIAVTIVMNGLDQNMMQKNLSCKNTRESQKNMQWFTLSFVITNILFLGVGVLLYKYAEVYHIALPNKSDEIYAYLSLNHFGLTASIFFLLGITAAAYSSADSALTSLTTSFCIDVLNINIHKHKNRRIKTITHIIFSTLMFFVIVTFKEINNSSVVNSIFTVAGYTYGPILGLFAFGLFTKNKIKDKLSPIVCILSPVICYFISVNSEKWLYGYKFGFELLIMNGIITFIGLLLIKRKK